MRRQTIVDVGSVQLETSLRVVDFDHLSKLVIYREVNLAEVRSRETEFDFFRIRQTSKSKKNFLKAVVRPRDERSCCLQRSDHSELETSVAVCVADRAQSAC